MTTADEEPKLAVRFRLYGTRGIQREVFAPLFQQFENDLKEYVDDEIPDGEQEPPQKHGGPEGPQMVVGEVCFLTVVVWLSLETGKWGWKKLLDASLGRAVDRFVDNAKVLLADVVGRQRDTEAVKRGYYKSPRDGVTLSIALYSPRDGKYAVLRIDADQRDALARAKPLVEPALQELQAKMRAGTEKPCLMYHIVNGDPPKQILELNEIPYEGEPVTTTS